MTDQEREKNTPTRTEEVMEQPQEKEEQEEEEQEECEEEAEEEEGEQEEDEEHEEEEQEDEEQEDENEEEHEEEQEEEEQEEEQEEEEEEEHTEEVDHEEDEKEVGEAQQAPDTHGEQEEDDEEEEEQEEDQGTEQEQGGSHSRDQSLHEAEERAAHEKETAGDKPPHPEGEQEDHEEEEEEPNDLQEAAQEEREEEDVGQEKVSGQEEQDNEHSDSHGEEEQEEQEEGQQAEEGANSRDEAHEDNQKTSEQPEGEVAEQENIHQEKEENHSTQASEHADEQEAASSTCADDPSEEQAETHSNSPSEHQQGEDKGEGDEGEEETHSVSSEQQQHDQEETEADTHGDCNTSRQTTPDLEQEQAEQQDEVLSAAHESSEHEQEGCDQEEEEQDDCYQEEDEEETRNPHDQPPQPDVSDYRDTDGEDDFSRMDDSLSEVVKSLQADEAGLLGKATKLQKEKLSKDISTFDVVAGVEKMRQSFLELQMNEEEYGDDELCLTADRPIKATKTSKQVEDNDFVDDGYGTGNEHDLQEDLRASLQQSLASMAELHCSTKNIAKSVDDDDYRAAPLDISLSLQQGGDADVIQGIIEGGDTVLCDEEQDQCDEPEEDDYGNTMDDDPVEVSKQEDFKEVKLSTSEVNQLLQLAKQQAEDLLNATFPGSGPNTLQSGADERNEASKQEPSSSATVLQTEEDDTVKQEPPRTITTVKESVDNENIKVVFSQEASGERCNSVPRSAHSLIHPFPGSRTHDLLESGCISRHTPKLDDESEDDKQLESVRLDASTSHHHPALHLSEQLIVSSSQQKDSPNTVNVDEQEAKEEEDTDCDHNDEEDDGSADEEVLAKLQLVNAITAELQESVKLEASTSHKHPPSSPGVYRKQDDEEKDQRPPSEPQPQQQEEVEEEEPPSADVGLTEEECLLKEKEAEAERYWQDLVAKGEVEEMSGLRNSVQIKNQPHDEVCEISDTDEEVKREDEEEEENALSKSVDNSNEPACVGEVKQSRLQIERPESVELKMKFTGGLSPKPHDAPGGGVLSPLRYSNAQQDEDDTQNEKSEGDSFDDEDGFAEADDEAVFTEEQRKLQEAERVHKSEKEWKAMEAEMQNLVKNMKHRRYVQHKKQKQVQKKRTPSLGGNKHPVHSQSDDIVGGVQPSDLQVAGGGIVATPAATTPTLEAAAAAAAAAAPYVPTLPPHPRAPPSGPASASSRHSQYSHPSSQLTPTGPTPHNKGITSTQSTPRSVASGPISVAPSNHKKTKPVKHSKPLQPPPEPDLSLGVVGFHLTVNPNSADHQDHFQLQKQPHPPSTTNQNNGGSKSPRQNPDKLYTKQAAELRQQRIKQREERKRKEKEELLQREKEAYLKRLEERENLRPSVQRKAEQAKAVKLRLQRQSEREKKRKEQVDQRKHELEEVAQVMAKKKKEHYQSLQAEQQEREQRTKMRTDALKARIRGAAPPASNAWDEENEDECNGGSKEGEENENQQGTEGTATTSNDTTKASNNTTTPNNVPSKSDSKTKKTSPPATIIPPLESNRGQALAHNLRVVQTARPSVATQNTIALKQGIPRPSSLPSSTTSPKLLNNKSNKRSYLGPMKPSNAKTMPASSATRSLPPILANILAN